MTDLLTAAGIVLGAAVAALFLLAPVLIALDELATIRNERRGARRPKTVAAAGAGRADLRHDRLPLTPLTPKTH